MLEKSINTSSYHFCLFEQTFSSLHPLNFGTLNPFILIQFQILFKFRKWKISIEKATFDQD